MAVSHHISLILFTILMLLMLSNVSAEVLHHALAQLNLGLYILHYIYIYAHIALLLYFNNTLTFRALIHIYIAKDFDFRAYPYAGRRVLLQYNTTGRGGYN